MPFFHATPQDKTRVAANVKTMDALILEHVSKIVTASETVIVHSVW
jgi:hypothetical protein